MKPFSVKSLLIAATATASLMSASLVNAQESESHDLMMGFNPFESTFSSVTAPSYMVGIKADEQLLPFGYAVVIDDETYSTDTVFGVGAGVRMYISDMSNRVRPYAGVAAGIVNAEDTGFGIGAFFGAEAMITSGVSISGQVGAEIADRGCNGCDSTFELGTANVMFNLYF